VLKYHEAIGVATVPIQVGDHVHVHNLESVRWGEKDGLCQGCG
jgi:altronate dehydratase